MNQTSSRRSFLQILVGTVLGSLALLRACAAGRAGVGTAPPGLDPAASSCFRLLSVDEDYPVPGLRVRKRTYQGPSGTRIEVEYTATQTFDLDPRGRILAVDPPLPVLVPGSACAIVLPGKSSVGEESETS